MEKQKFRIDKIIIGMIVIALLLVVCFSEILVVHAQTFEKGHYYLVKMNVENDTTDRGTQKDYGDEQINTIQMYSLAKEAIVYRTDDGNYEVTIRIDDWDLSSNEIAYQISKEGAFDESVSTYKIPFGDYNLKDKVFYDKLCSNGAKTVDEKYNEKYFQEDELKIEEDSQSAVTKYVTFPMDNIEGTFYINKIYNKDAYNSTIRISLACSGAKEISDDLGNYTKGYEVKTAVSGIYSYYNSATDCDKVEKILSESKTEKSADGLSQNIKIDLNQTAQSVLLDTAQVYAGRNYDKNWTAQDTTSEISLSYSSVKEAVFGKSVKLTTDGGKAYWIRIGLREEEEREETKTSNGVTLKYSTDVVDSDADFNAYELKSGMDYYDKVKSQMGAAVSEFKAYRTSLVQNGENYQPYKRVNLEFDLPQGWNADTTTVYVVVPAVNGYDELTAKNENRGAGTFEIKDNKVILSTTLVNEVSTYANYTGPIVWVLANTAQPFDVNTLSDGVYKVGIEMVNETDITSLSMSNAAIKNHEGTLYVYNNGADKDLYLDMDSVSIGSMRGYLYRMYTYPEKNSTVADKKEVNYISYKVDENKNPIDDEINKEDKISETILYPQKLAMKIPTTYDVEQDGTTISNVFKVNCNVPIMDIVGGAVAGSGDYARDAYVRMLNATKVENEEIHELTPSLTSVDKTQLKNVLDEANDCITNPKENYIKKNLAALKEKTATAQEVYEYVNATQKEVDKQTEILKNSISSLEGYKAGVYTMDTDSAFANSSENVQITGVVGETRAVVAEDLTATVYMNITKETTSMPAFDYSEDSWITGLLYKDSDGKYQTAKVEEKDKDGNITKVSFPVNGLTDNLELAFTLPDDTEQYQVSVALSNVEKQSVDKSELKSKISEATEKLSGNYTQESLTKLQKTISEATLVNENPVAIQNEIDEQIKKIDNAISELKNNIDFSELNKAIEKAEKINEDDYTPNSYKKLSDELEAAKLVSTDTNATQDEITNATVKLNAAYKGLIKRANKKELQATYEKAIAIENKNYPGWDKLQTAITNAKVVLDNANASQDEVDDQVNALTIAINNLSGTTDKSALESLVAEAKKLDTSAYTDSSVKAFNSAITSAEKVLNDPNATQEEVDKQIKLLKAQAEALIGKTQDNVVYDGVYEITGRMWQAKADSASMGNAALAQPMQIVVSTDKETGKTSVKLRMEFVPLTTSGFTGYLYKLNYFPEWDKDEIPKTETPVEANVETWYEDTYDEFNDPQNALDKNVQGKIYPHIMNIPIELGENEVWVQVYVPVMEYIGIQAGQTGSGWQYAKLQIDWDSRKQISGIDTDKSKLKALITKAKEIEQGEYSDEVYNALADAIVAAEDVVNNMNVDQTMIDNTQKALQAAMDALSKTEVKTDKSELQSVLKKAKTIIEDKEINYTETSIQSLKNAYDMAQAVYNNEVATQTEIETAISQLNTAIDALQIEGADKAELKKALSTTKEYLSDTENYTAASLEALKSLYDTAKEVYADKNATQEEVDAQVRILNYAVKNLKKVEEVTVDKSGLHNMLLTASNMAGRENLYTADSIKNLKAAIKAAEAVYEDENATQEEVNEQASKLSIAMINLETKPSDSNNNGNNNGGNNNNNNNDNNNTGLDIKNLADGVYSITGSMVKVDKTTASMSDGAINHTIKLTVKNGKYYITLNFNGLTVG